MAIGERQPQAHNLRRHSSLFGEGEHAPELFKNKFKKACLELGTEGEKKRERGKSFQVLRV